MRLIDEDPCDGCAEKVDDVYGRFCDLTCGKYSTYIIKQEAYKAQLKKVVEELGISAEHYKANIDGFVVSWEKWQALLEEVKE